MKATLEFDLNDPDDRMAHLRAIKSLDMAMVLWEIQSNLRKRVEWELESFEADSDRFDGAYAVFRRIGELMDERGINVDDLIM
jgi:hypothetical protein